METTARTGGDGEDAGLGTPPTDTFSGDGRAISPIMAPKRTFIWNNIFKVKRRLFNNFKRRSSGLNVSGPRPDVPMPHFMPAFPHQERCNRIASSVVRLHTHKEYNPEKHSTLPAMIFKSEKDSCCLLFGESLVDFGVGPFKLTFPNKEVVELPLNAKRGKKTSIDEDDFELAALSCKTTERFQSIEFGQNVIRNQTVYLFDFRHGNPSVTKGRVAYADSLHFLLSPRPHTFFFYGALVFDEAEKLVGVVYSHLGSPQAIQVNHLKKMVSELFQGK